MQSIRNLTEDILWIGGSDRRKSRFENIFPIPRGVSYNAYLVMDEKTVLLDTADGDIRETFINNLTGALNGRDLDYLIVNHMEPDHCSMIGELALRYPQMKLIGNQKTFVMIKQFFDFDVDARAVVVAEGDTFSSGSHTFRFVMAPMVHWPEAMVTYEEENGILFSADAFGSFGALHGNLFNDEIEFDKDWSDDARRYYTNIVGKYGAPVQALLKKAAGLEIRMICPLHGPVWRNNLEYLLEKYQKWSTYEPEEHTVCVMYATMYGNTARAAEALAAKLSAAGAAVAVYDVSETDPSELVAEAFRCSHLVFAAPTYNGGLYPKMEYLLNDMKALNLQKRTVALMENGTWAPTAAKQMREILDGMKDITVLEPVITVKSTLKNQQEEQLDELVKQIKESL